MTLDPLRNSGLLDVQDLHVRFQSKGRDVHAVRGVSFSLREGEILGIVGESGCGKSATVKALLKLLPPHHTKISGNIRYGNENLTGYSEKQMQKIRGKEISMIFQDPMTSLNPTLKIGTQIIEGYLHHFPEISKKDAWTYATDLLHTVGIPDPESRMHSYPHTLSGGMRQRVMIAIALACKPNILFGDEPTTALDVTIQAGILKLMKEIQQKTGMSILLITHDLSVVANFCDRVLVMYAGKIVESATVNELFSNPQHPYTQLLLRSIPKLNQPKSQPLIPIEGSPPSLTFPLPGCGFCPRCPYAMNICKQEAPPLFVLKNQDHLTACFKHDPRNHPCP